MIIGISGYIGSGKDTVANMIRYVIAQYELHGQLEGDPESPGFQEGVDYQYKTYWEIRKFAGKLKQIVSILTGIPLEDLEKQEVKDSELGEEWWFWRYITPGHAGYGNILTYQPGVSKSDSNLLLIKPTVRWLLQTLGTDAMSDVIHPNIHVNALFADYKGIIPEARNIKDKNPLSAIPEESLSYPNWLLADMRFPNEMEAVKQKGGITVRVERKECGFSWDKEKPQRHTSETSLDSAKFDFTIDNSYDIPTLLEAVRTMLIRFKLI